MLNHSRFLQWAVLSVISLLMVMASRKLVRPQPGLCLQQELNSQSMNICLECTSSPGSSELSWDISSSKISFLILPRVSSDTCSMQTSSSALGKLMSFLMYLSLFLSRLCLPALRAKLYAFHIVYLWHLPRTCQTEDSKHRLWKEYGPNQWSLLGTVYQGNHWNSSLLHPLVFSRGPRMSRRCRWVNISILLLPPFCVTRFPSALKCPMATCFVTCIFWPWLCS